jgi:diguanylate cyclase (GGDEF)-like protein/PAS domain S-box-containing protein
VSPTDEGFLARLWRLVFFDYPKAATTYWLVLVLAGAVALTLAALQVAAAQTMQMLQILGVAAMAAIVGLFPLRIPKSKNSIAAADIFIFLLLLIDGPSAAVLAATAEAAICSWRTSRRLTSRVVSPAAAALAMSLCGHGFALGVEALGRIGMSGHGALFGAMMFFAVTYFIVSPTLVTAVIYLKRERGPSLAEWLNNFGWLGMGYAASASVAFVLNVAFQAFGAVMLLVAVPMIAMFLATLHYYFAEQEAAEREAAERVIRERAEAAHREAAQAAQHLRELEISDKRFHSAFSHAAIGMALVSVEGHVVQVNRALAALLGRSEEDIVGREFRSLVAASDEEELKRQLQQVRQHQADGFSVEMRMRGARATDVWVSLHCSFFSDAEDIQPCLIFQAFDVSARRQAESRLQHMAYHDGLTNLFNRSHLQEALARAIEVFAADPARQFSLMYLDFDRFKLINDSMGHGAGDEFLIKVAQRLQGQLRPDDVLARLGGDEFAILSEHHGSTHHAVTLAERLQSILRKPFTIEGTEVAATASIGITFSDVGYCTPEEVLRDADLAMYKAKASGKARYALFDTSLRERATEQLLLEAELRRAFGSDQLLLAFQPIYQLDPRRLVGFEALARWDHPVRGAVSPARFIPICEESGLMGQFTLWAIGRACAQLSLWQEQCPALAHLFVNVNISSRDLCEPAFSGQVRDILQQFDVAPSCLTLEITESILMQNLNTSSMALAHLRQLGVGLSVDDFGTGYSSLSYLSKLPISSLKIDRSFVGQLDSQSNDAEIVNAVIKLGAALGKRVIAEGIETSVQLQRLRELGCAFGQGYGLGRPMTARAATLLLEEMAEGLEPPMKPAQLRVEQMITNAAL